jgi:hypothetical protein
VKGKQARIDVRPPSASATPHKVLVRPQATVKADDGRVAYYAMLDSVPSMESCTLPSSDSSGLESILALPPPILDVHISAELPMMPEAGTAE